VKPEGAGVDPGMMKPEGDAAIPDGNRNDQKGQGRPQGPGGFGMIQGDELSTEFEIVEGGNYFSFVSEMK